MPGALEVIDFNGRYHVEPSTRTVVQAVPVDKTVAEQEEHIKELRVVEEAKRNKQALVINAHQV